MPEVKKPAKSARRSAAMLGNRNALKHGFYARKMIPLELSDLDTALGDGLTDEIALLRVIIRRVFDFANDHEKQNLRNLVRFAQHPGRCLHQARRFNPH